MHQSHASNSTSTASYSPLKCPCQHYSSLPSCAVDRLPPQNSALKPISCSNWICLVACRAPWGWGISRVCASSARTGALQCASYFESKGVLTDERIEKRPGWRTLASVIPAYCSDCRQHRHVVKMNWALGCLNCTHFTRIARVGNTCPRLWPSWS